jgi:hypothetical protein
MKKQRQSRNKQGGFALIDLAFWVGGFLASSVYISGLVAGEQENLLAQRTVTDMALVVNASRSYKSHQTDGYASVSVSNLTDASVAYLANRFKTGVGINEWGGNYTTAAGATASDLTVTSTGLPIAVCNKIANALSKDFDATCATGTVTLKTI